MPTAKEKARAYQDKRNLKAKEDLRAYTKKIRDLRAKIQKDEEAKGKELKKRTITQHEEYNPTLYKNGVYTPPKGDLLTEADPYFENIPTKTDQQAKLMKFLMSTVSQELPGLIGQMSQPASMDIFSHMSNPVIQKMLNPQVLYPSQMQDQMYPGLEGLLGELGSQGAQYAVNKAPEIWDYMKNNAPGAYNYAAESRPGQFVQGLPSNIMGMLSSLGNKFRPQQQ